MAYHILVRRYLEYIKKTFKSDDAFLTDRVQMTELLRHALCLGMGISSKPLNTRVDESARKCSKYMFKGISMSDWTLEDKFGVLEASIKLLSLAIKKGES